MFRFSIIFPLYAYIEIIHYIGIIGKLFGYARYKYTVTTDT